MLIRNGTVFCEDGRFRARDVRVEGDVIAELGEALPSGGEEVVDAEGCYVLPGLIDMHFHGCRGDDFCDGTEEAFDRIARYEAFLGVTSICPATMTLPLGELDRVLTAAKAYRARQERGEALRGRAALIGVNMEGPFISPVKKGAQDAQYILPCSAAIARRFLLESGGLVKVLGLAPEEGDAESVAAYIREISREVIVSIAHSNADYDTARAAFAAGASHVVHLFNAMPELLHRAPGVVGAAADEEAVTAELICDGNHVHPAVVRAAFRLFGASRVILISDSMRAAGLSDGTYTLGGQEVEVRGSRAVLAGSDALAGSVTPLPDCVRTAVLRMGIRLEDALLAATANPAKRLSVYDRRGSVSVGKTADLVLWERGLALREVILRGERLA